MAKKPNGYWQKKENIKKLIKDINATKISDIHDRYSAAFKSMRINGWVDEFFPNRRKINQWDGKSKKEIKKKASEYKNQSEFQSRCKPAYDIAKKNGWLSEFYTIRRSLTYKKCKEEVGKYNSYSELYQKDVSILMKIQSKGWEDLISHWEMPFSSKNLKWTYERCKEEIKKFKYLNDLQGTSVVNAIRNNGWDELTKNLIRQTTEPYTEEEVLKESLKYNTRNDFRIGSAGQYGAARRLNIMDKATKHMGKSKNKKQYTEEEILKSANKFNNQKEWLENEPAIFRCALGYNKKKTSDEDKKFFNKCISHMDYIFKPNGYWTYDKAKEVASKFNQLKDFREDKKYRSVYGVINKNGWVELIEHMEHARKPNGYWTYESCKEAALKYKKRSEFCKSEDCTAYHMINQNKWVELLKHMKREMTLKQRVIYACEFPINNVAYIGLTCSIKRRQNAHLGKEKRYGKIVSSVYNFSVEYGESMKFRVLTKKPIKEENASKSEGYYIEKYKNNGWVLLNKSKAGSLGGNQKKWTKDKLRTICDSCVMLSDLKKKIPLWAIYVIRSNGWWDEIASHLIYDGPTIWTDEEVLKISYQFDRVSDLQKKYPGVQKYLIRNPHLKNEMDIYWAKRKEQKIKDNLPTKEQCVETALKYSKRTDFRKGEFKIFNYSFKNGWIDEICKHMIIPKSSVYWTYERCKEESLKYNNRDDFKKNGRSCYNIIYKNKWHELLTPLNCNVKKEYKYNGKYSKEMLMDIASNCRNKSDFQERFSGAYKAAYKLNCMNELLYLKS